MSSYDLSADLCNPQQNAVTKCCVVVSGGFQMNQKYLNFKFSSLPITLFLKRVYNSFDSYYNQQKTVQGFLESPHPGSFTCLGIKFKSLCHFPGHLGAEYFEGGEQTTKRQIQAALFGRMTVICLPFRLSFLCTVGKVSTGSWYQQRCRSSNTIFAISWCCFKISIFLETILGQNYPRQAIKHACSLQP